MGSNRPKSKVTLFKETKLDRIQTDYISPSKSDLHAAVDESNDRANRIIQAINSSAMRPANLIADYLNKQKVESRASIADKIMRELSALSKFYKNSSDQVVVSDVMNKTKIFLDDIKRRGYENRPKRYPSCKFDDIQLLSEIIPNYLEVIRYHPFDENKEEASSPQTPKAKP
jgi:hypothetical protein